MPAVIDLTSILNLPTLLEAAGAPSPFLDARLRAWGGLPAGTAPTSSMEAADAFCQTVAPGTTWVLKGSAEEGIASITSLGGAALIVLFTARAGLPGLALLAAFVRACEGLTDSE
jgi:hypothetical protein